MEKDKRLYDVKEFFKLEPVDFFSEEAQDSLIAINSRDQPTGFVDEKGNVWVPIQTKDGLKRREL